MPINWHVSAPNKSVAHINSSAQLDRIFESDACKILPSRLRNSHPFATKIKTFTEYPLMEVDISPKIKVLQDCNTRIRRYAPYAMKIRKKIHIKKIITDTIPCMPVMYQKVLKK